MITMDEGQREAKDSLDSGKILVGKPGSGKSLTAVVYYLEKESPSDVYVITTARKRDTHDWEREFAHFGIGTSGGSTVGGVLTVDSWNNIAKYIDIKNAFFIFDEQHLVGSGAWTRSFLKIAGHNRWILLSGTPGDTWVDYIPVFVANGFYKNRTQFKQEHVIYKPYSKFPKVDRYVGTGKLVRLRNQIVVPLRHERHTTRKTTWKTVEHDDHILEDAKKRRWNVIDDKPLRDRADLFRISRRLVNDTQHRLDAVRDILTVHPRLIVFYNFDYELERLRTVISEDEYYGLDKSTVVAEGNGHKHEDVPTSEKWVYLVQYTAGAEAWDCTTTDAMCMYSLNYSYRIWEQAFGRIDRRNTPYSTLHYYVLVTNSWIDKSIKKALSAKKNFNEATCGVDF